MPAPGAQVLDMPGFITIIKIVQAVLAVILLGLSAYQESVVAWSGGGFLLWTCIFSILTLAYYFVSVFFVKSVYNWIALIVIESFSVLWWLISWALQAALLGGAFYFNNYYDDGYYDWYYAKRSLVKRDNYGTFGDVVIASLTFALVNWFLYIATLVFMVIAVVKHGRRNHNTQPSAPAVPVTEQSKEAHQMEAVPQQQTV